MTSLTPLQFTLVAANCLLLFTGTRAQPQDNRCFLEGGGSAENFFVSETLPVGSVIGILRVIGNPGFNGDIGLKLSSQNKVVAIAENSKNLTLISPLDKEEVNGPSSVLLSVVCERRGFSTDPSFTIPVHIRVTDANDNSPVFLNAPYYVNISESTLVGSSVKQGIKATDADQPGPFSTVQYSINPGPFSDLFDFVSSLEGNLILKKSLDYEAVNHFNITIRATDQGNPALWSETSLTVTVLDSDDQNPVFAQTRYFTNLPQNAQQGSKLVIRPEALHAFDQDSGINAPVYYTWHGDGPEYKYFLLDQITGEIRLTRNVENNELVQPATLVVKAYQADNGDRYALATLSVSRGPAFSPILQFLQRVYNAAVLENTPLNTVLVSLAVNKPGSGNLQFFIEPNNDNQNRFSVDQAGEVILRQPLDFETEELHQLVVWATDGVNNDTALVNITVLNVNDWDPRFRYSSYEFYVTDLQAKQGFVIGQIEVADGDKNDRLDLELKGPDARCFSISPDGDVVLFDPMQLNSTEASFMITARDSGIPPRQSSVPVKVNFPHEFLLLQRQQIPGWSAGSSTLLLLVFGVLLGILILVISGLAVYVCQYKKNRKVDPQPPKSTTELCSPMEMNRNPGIVATLRRMPINPLARNPCQRRVVPTKSPISPPLSTSSPRSSTSHTTLRPSSSDSRENQSPLDGNVGNRDDRPEHLQSPVPELNSEAVDPIRITNGRITLDMAESKISWPQGSIPKRVKKLSWEDEYNVFF